VSAPVDVDHAVGPVRTCVGCRRKDQRSVLLRVVTGDGEHSRAVVDPERIRPGRGAWLHADLQCLELAERRRAFTRALRVERLDLVSVREYLEAGGAEHEARPSFTDTGSGLEADGHPMSTQR
jgi:uncharacterized protein